MNIWGQIAWKIGEKIVVNEIKRNVWNNPYATYQQKRFTSNLIDTASFAKDIYDIARIIDNSGNNSRQGGNS